MIKPLRGLLMDKRTNDENMKMVLNVMSHYPELYNKVANCIYKNFQFASAEVTLFTSYIVLMTIKNDSEFVEKMLEADDER